MKYLRSAYGLCKHSIRQVHHQTKSQWSNGPPANSHWWLLLSRWELNSYTLQHCSPQMLHFQGLESQWQPLCRKYSVESGNVMEQNVHTRDDGSMAASPCVEVITPPSDGEAREAWNRNNQGSRKCYSKASAKEQLLFSSSNS